MPVMPVLRGLYLCTRVDVDPDTTNLTLVNCFRTLIREDGTGRAGAFCLVAYLANGQGTVPVVVKVSRMDTMDPVYAARVGVTFRDRLQEVRFKLRVEQCRFPVPGEYEASLWAGDDLLAQTPFLVRDREEG